MRGARRGFTFLEILIGIFILSVALMPLMGLSMTTLKGVQVSLDEIEATNAATAVLESIQVAPWDLLEEIYDDPGVPFEELPEDLRIALHIPSLPEKFQVFVNIMHSEVAPLRGEDSLGEAATARLRELRQIRLVEVRCRFQTKALDERIGSMRDRQIEVSTVVSRAGRI